MDGPSWEDCPYCDALVADSDSECWECGESLPHAWTEAELHAWLRERLTGDVKRNQHT